MKLKLILFSMLVLSAADFEKGYAVIKKGKKVFHKITVA